MKKSLCLMAVLSFMFTGISLWAQDESVVLKYQFRQGETLRYKLENHDSTSMNMGGQANTMTMTRHSIQSLQVRQTPPDQYYKINVKTDTSWSDMNMGRQRARRRGPSVTPIEMNEWGKSKSKNDIILPFILPLPEHAVKVNDIWTFDLTKKLKGRAKGEQQVKGQCQIYQIKEENGIQVAVIIVNTESHSNSTFKGNFNGRDVSVTTATSALAQQLVYFDVNHGRVIEVIGEGSAESTSEGTQSGSRNSQSKSIIRLITE